MANRFSAHRLWIVCLASVCGIIHANAASSTSSGASGVTPPGVGMVYTEMHKAGIWAKFGTEKVGLHPNSEDYATFCEAGADVEEDDCPMPHAKAFDTRNNELVVNRTIYLTNLDGDMVDPPRLVDQANFSRRSAYLFEYTAEDNSGNQAERVVFSLILDDFIKPNITLCEVPESTVEVEAGSDWSLCSGSSAQDNLDNDVTNTIRYRVQDIVHVEDICNGCTLEQARKALSSSRLGEYRVMVSAHDHAGVFGAHMTDNTQITAYHVIVRDTLPPWVIIHGTNPTFQQCGEPYDDMMVTGRDQLDTDALNLTLSVQSNSSNLQTHATGHFSIAYFTHDGMGHKSPVVFRGVEVMDTVPPRISLQGDAELVHVVGQPFVDPGVNTSDSCDGDVVVTTEWDYDWLNHGITHADRQQHNGPLLGAPGHYTLTYTATDAVGLTSSIARVFVVQDEGAPIIYLRGAYTLTIEGSMDAEYEDEGARCYDEVEGDISTKLRVDGMVDPTTPGTYTLVFRCQDSFSNTADAINRTVLVEDTTCPSISLLAGDGSTLLPAGQGVLTFAEAGFDWLDPWAKAEDAVDGDLTSAIWNDGDR